MISLGQRVQRYRVEAWSGGTWQTVVEGTTIGHRKLDRIQRVRASKVRLTILQARACPVIRSFGLHLDTVSPPASFLELARPRTCSTPGKTESAAQSCRVEFSLEKLGWQPIDE